MSDRDSIITILTSVGTQRQAIDISEHLVNQRLATCVNIVPCLRTVYRWTNDKIRDDTEYLLFIKTTKAREDEVYKAATNMNPYSIPEVLTICNPQVEQVTSNWIAEMTRDPEA